MAHDADDGGLPDARINASDVVQQMLLDAHRQRHQFRGQGPSEPADASAALPDAQREAIVLHYWRGCSLADTAEQLGGTPAAVAGLLHRGLRTLRGLLNESE